MIVAASVVDDITVVDAGGDHRTNGIRLQSSPEADDLLGSVLEAKVQLRCGGRLFAIYAVRFVGEPCTTLCTKPWSLPG